MEELEGLETKSGQSIDVLERIATEYETFGIKILEDETGDTVEVIKEDERSAGRIKRQIAMQWLKGKGKQPVTWGTLVHVLESMKLRELAKKIREALQ